jgi:hypothetical protein
MYTFPSAKGVSQSLITKFHAKNGLAITLETLTYGLYPSIWNFHYKNKILA